MKIRIFYAVFPLAERYLEILENVKTISTNRQTLAGWANRLWALDVGQILATLSNPEALQHLRLTGPFASEDHDVEDTKMFFNLVVSTASQRCWSMAICELPPDNWFGILDDDIGYAGASRRRMQDDYLLMKKIRDVLDEVDVAPRIKKACEWHGSVLSDASFDNCQH